MECQLVVYLLFKCLFLVRATGEPFTYNIPNGWKSKFPECGGKRQSPIALKYSEVIHQNIPPLAFINYNIPVSGHVQAINNGHTVQIDIPKTADEHAPCLHGGGLNFIYKVKGFHFHWGSPGVPGSEHSINGNKYDLELHIVHKKIPYHTLEEARTDPHGIAVLTVLFQGVQDGRVGSTDLDEFYEALPYLTEYESHIELQLMRMGQFLGKLNTEEFYTYNGSLTTPPCPEAAIWFVFPDVLPIEHKYVIHQNLPPLAFINYNIPVSGHVQAINNGHTVQIDIPKTDDEHAPCLHGGGLNFIYKVKGFHFHWGSPGVPGSEHSINGNKYDLELHIVHKKIPYHTLEEARTDPHGIAVLTVLFQGVQDGRVGSTDLDEFYEALPYLTEYESHIELQLMRMGQFLGKLNTEEFYTYNGSLTTPPCPEAAIWFVFPDVLPIEHKYLERFWNLHDSKSELLLHNQRPIQPTNSRTVYYRRGNKRL